MASMIDDLDFRVAATIPGLARKFPDWVQKFPFGLPREFAHKRLTDNAHFDGPVGDFDKIPG